MAKGTAPKINYDGSSSLGYKNHMGLKHTAENADSMGYIRTSDPTIRYDVNTGEYRRISAPTVKAPTPTAQKTPKAKAKAKPTYKPKTAGKKPAPSYLKSNTTKDAGGTNRSTGYHYNPDWNANLKEATIRGNEENTKAIDKLNLFARNRAKSFGEETSGFTTGAKDRLDSAYSKYNGDITSLMDKMGTADQDIHARNRGSAFAGLDSGFAEAGDQLQARLAQRGMANSGVGVKAYTDMARDRAIAGSQANTNAYTSAIDMSDNRRNNKMGTIGNLYGANQANINNGYQMQMSNAGQRYGNEVAVEGQAMQNNINNNQQRIANLMGYSQLGRGMAGMSQNYLSQAGSGFGNIAGQAGQTAIGVGSNNNSYNATMQQAQSAQNQANADAAAGKGSAVGSLVGAGITKYSDSRLKMNVKKIGESNGHNIVTWDWNEIGKEIAGDAPTVGVIAQEAEKIDPSSVTVADNGYMKVDYNKIFNGVA